MSITTGGGDRGETGLGFGTRVPKDDPRIECLGTIDELDSFLGDARCAATLEAVRARLDAVQHDLGRLAAAVADASDRAAALTPADADRLEAWVQEVEALVPLRGFVLPGSTPASARLDICRTVCRRAERRAVSLRRVGPLDPVVLVYLNRLSDLLFMLARWDEHSAGALRYATTPRG